MRKESGQKCERPYIPQHGDADLRGGSLLRQLAAIPRVRGRPLALRPSLSTGLPVRAVNELLFDARLGRAWSALGSPCAPQEYTRP